MGETFDEAASASAPLPDPDAIGLLCHDLRQPLVVAVGYVSMLGEGTFGDLPEPAREVLATVAERLDAMNTIISRLTDRV